MNPTTPTVRASQPAQAPAIEAAAADWVTRVDAGLTKEEQQIFQDWLSGDPRHAEEFDRLTEAWSVFDRVQEKGAASLILDRLAERAHRRRTRRAQAGVAAGLVLAAGLFYFQWRAAAPGLARSSSSPAITQTNPVAPAFDPIRKLPDGSIVELNAGAEIEVQYSAAERRVKLLKGEAFFRVEKNKARPFYVESHGVVVRAVGTAFAVQMQPTAVEVVVQEGVVDVGRTTATGAADGQPVRVEAGKRVVMALILLRPAGRIPAIKAAEPESPAPTAQPEAMDEEQMDARLAWRLPRLEFEGLPLSEAVALLNRHNKLQLRIEGAALGATRYTANFRSDNPEGFVRILVESGEVTIERPSADEIVLRPAK